MRTDPYSILGVSRDASNREVRIAYRKRKKQYRAPKFGQKDLRNLARERQAQKRQFPWQGAWERNPPR